MSWIIEYAVPTEKQFKKLGKVERDRILDKMEEIAALEDPRSRGKGLTGNKSGLWRYRIGSYRVLTEIQDEKITILVLKVGNRSDVYD